jgi:phage tail-like protein
MAQFTVNTHRFDPYKNFKFRVKWDGRYVAGVSKVGSLKRSTEVVEHREGRRSQHQPQVPRPYQV